jgi:16S rRNA processing protein RimM
LPKGKVACGKFLKPFGVRGELKFEPYLPDDLDTASITSGMLHYRPEKGRAAREVLILSARPLSSGLWALHPDGCESPEEAAEYTNAELWVDRVKFPPLEEGQYLSQDIIGCRVSDARGNDLGQVRAVFSTGANDIWELAGKDGREILIPAIKDVVVSVDVENRAITINVLEGLLD